MSDFRIQFLFTRSHFVRPRPRDRLSYPVSFPVPVVCRHSLATFYILIVSSFVDGVFFFAFSNSTNIIALHSWLQIARWRCTVLLGKVRSACAYRSYVECRVYVWPVPHRARRHGKCKNHWNTRAAFAHIEWHVMSSWECHKFTVLSSNVWRSLCPRILHP